MTNSESLAERRVLVTGASGFLGMHLCRRLRRAGADVYGVSRSAPHDSECSMHWLRADMAEAAAVGEIIGTVQPDFIYHLSGYGVGAPDLVNVLPAFRNDLMTTVNVLTSAAKSGITRLVMAASLEEPQAGSSDPIPSSPYAAAKWAGGAYARMFYRLYGTPVVMTRPMMTYGPGQRPHKLVPYVTLALLQGQAPRLSSGTRGVDWVYVDDVIEGMLAAAVTPGIEGCTIDLGSGVLVPIHEVVSQLVELTGSDVVPQFGAIPDRPMEKTRVADVADAQEKLGWKVRTSLRAGLEKTVEWYRKELSQSAVGAARTERAQ